MREIAKKVHSYLAFDGPLEIGRISSTFALTQNQQSQAIPGWGTDSTRQKLVSTYWFTDVVRHFTALLGMAIIIALPMSHSFNRYTLLSVFSVAILSFLILLFFQYLPNFTSNFLPKLEAIRSDYDARKQSEIIQRLHEQLSSQQDQIAKQQQEFQQALHDLSVDQQKAYQVELQQRLAEQQDRIVKQQERIQRRIQVEVSEQSTSVARQKDELKKCRQAQLSNFSLTLVYFALAKLSGVDGIIANEQTSKLLLKMFGVDRGSLRNNLELIVGNGSKWKDMGERKQTETRNRFEEATSFLREMGCPKGVSLLKELEIKMLGN